jgi:hypothetical protein
MTSTFNTSSGVTLTAFIFYQLTEGASILPPLSILPKIIYIGHGVLNIQEYIPRNASYFPSLHLKKLSLSNVNLLRVTNTIWFLIYLEYFTSSSLQIDIYIYIYIAEHIT